MQSDKDNSPRMELLSQLFCFSGLKVNVCSNSSVVYVFLFCSPVLFKREYKTVLMKAGEQWDDRVVSNNFII